MSWSKSGIKLFTVELFWLLNALPTFNYKFSIWKFVTAEVRHVLINLELCSHFSKNLVHSQPINMWCVGKLHIFLFQNLYSEPSLCFKLFAHHHITNEAWCWLDLRWHIVLPFGGNHGVDLPLWSPLDSDLLPVEFFEYFHVATIYLIND